MTRSFWSIALAPSVAIGAAAVAREAQFRVDVSGGALGDAIVSLSAQTGASIGTTVDLRGRTAPAVRGRMDAGEALRRLLARSTLRAERVGEGMWRLVPRQTVGPPVDTAPAAPPREIVVTGRKLQEALSRVPAPVQVWVPDRAGERTGARADVHEVARATDGLSVTNLGPGRDRPFIRGVADSPFNGFSQTTVSVTVDDARVTYDAPDPGLRLVDVARVEVLKGPQGPLYGTGALGGVLRVVTNRPVLGATQASVTSGLGTVAGGGSGGDAAVMVNAPLLHDAVAVRLVGYAVADGGWVDVAGGRRDVNDTLVAGGRLAARTEPAQGWTLDVAGAIQRIGQRDSQYVDRGAEDLTRSSRTAEPSRSVFKLAHATIEGNVGGATLTVASSHAWQDRSETYALGGAGKALGHPEANRYEDRRSNRVFDQEIRLASVPGGRLAWLVGASHLSATTRATGDVGAASSVGVRVFDLHRAITETAAFVQVEAPLVGGMRLSAGGRAFLATTDDERREESAQPAVRARAKIGFTPSASLAYAFTPERLVYVRFGSAFRPGGLDPENARTGRYDADEVGSLDLGTRLSFAGGRLAMTAAGFRSAWGSVQSDYLQTDGLVATRNAGDALIVGGEFSVDWRPGAWWLGAGATGQRARLVRGIDGGDRPSDPRLPVVPDVTARIEVGRSIRIAGRRAELHLAVTYVGRSRLSFDQGLDRAMGDYAAVRAGASLALGEVDIRLDLDNLFDTQADSFAFGNPFLVRDERQFTPLRPRSVRIGFSRGF